MEIYSLTNRGRRLAHNIRAPRTPEYGIIFFLNKRGLASKEQILEYVPGATGSMLAKLRLKKVITEGSEVEI